ncbi:MAG TPA: prolyl oligopeptidase family serine peptidase [Pseudonocardiaceae bacterium]|nr:prolyl oligopeptidase family serine peptidase [Pseudonocardiaceae bacterium]
MTEVDDVTPELIAELIVDGSTPGAPVLSPDGRWVVYPVTTVGQVGPHPVGALWLAAVDGGTPPRRLTEGTTNDTAPRWSADSKSIFFRSDRVEPGSAQLCRLTPADSRVDVLTAWPTGIDDHLPLADPDLVALLATDDRRDEDVIVRGTEFRPGRLRLLDLRTGVVRTPDVLTGRHVVELAQRPDGGPLAVLSWATPEFDPGFRTAELHLVDLAGGPTRELGPAELEAAQLTWWSTGNGWRLAYLGVTPPGLIGGWAVFDLPTLDLAAEGLAEHRNLTAGLAACPLEMVQAATPLVLVAHGLDTAIHRLTPTGLDEVHRVTGSVRSLTASRSGELVAALVSTSTEVFDVHAGPPTGPLRRLSDTRPELRAIRWGTQERLAYRAADGLDLDGLLILPAGQPRSAGPFPLITWVHGGPYWRQADELVLNWVPTGQWLATAGYAVFLPNPRGGAGHGHEFAVRVDGALGQEEWTDISTGIDLLVDAGIADPDRLGIGGGSHGGYLTAWAVGRTDRFRAGLMLAGISDWGMQAATGEQGAFESALGGSTGWEGVGPHPHDRVSPISYAARMRTPLLMLHGAWDTNVPVSQAEFLHRALRRFGVEHEFVVYPREGHSFTERGHQLDVLRRGRAWFDRWLLGSSASKPLR